MSERDVCAHPFTGDGLYASTKSVFKPVINLLLFQVLMHENIKKLRGKKSLDYRFSL